MKNKKKLHPIITTVTLTIITCVVFGLSGCSKKDTAKPTGNTVTNEISPSVDSTDKATENDATNSPENSTTTPEITEDTINSTPSPQTTESASTPSPQITEGKVTNSPAVSVTKEASAPTKQPTPAPTKKPTAALTKKPTATPTKKPTATPTKKPTATPTRKPNAILTKKPTIPSVNQGTYTLSNPNANATTKKVFNYLCQNFGQNILSCQQESTWMGTPDYEINYIKNTTGKLPAIRGLDFMNNDFDGVTQRAIEWWNKGGLVTIMWHTGVYGSGYTECLNDNPNFSKLLTKGTAEYNAMIASWDQAAAALSELQDAGVTVIWRPFHEFDGQWFWWGKGGSQNFIKLWQMMYDRFTNVHGLNNLIWVLGYSGEVKDGWYPGDDYCDIIGSDTYDNSTNKNGWDRLLSVSQNKLLTFHECGKVPSVENFVNDGTMWSWFMIWHTDYITSNSKTTLKSVYNHELVITLDELPAFK